MDELRNALDRDAERLYYQRAEALDKVSTELSMLRAENQRLERALREIAMAGIVEARSPWCEYCANRINIARAAIEKKGVSDG